MRNKNDCVQYIKDLKKLILTGKASDEYIKHMAECKECTKKMQSQILCGIKALNG